MNTKLFLCVVCLYPNDSFSSLDKQKLIHLIEYYLEDFSAVDTVTTDNQFETYIIDMCSSKNFIWLQSIGELSQMIVETKKN